MTMKKLKGWRTYALTALSLGLLLLDGFANSAQALQWVATLTGVDDSIVVGVVFSALATWLRSITTGPHMSKGEPDADLPQ